MHSPSTPPSCSRLSHFSGWKNSLSKPMNSACTRRRSASVAIAIPAPAAPTAHSGTLAVGTFIEAITVIAPLDALRPYCTSPSSMCMSSSRSVSISNTSITAKAAMAPGCAIHWSDAGRLT